MILKEKKRPGGAAREREKNKKLLLESSKSCKKISSFFNNSYSGKCYALFVINYLCNLEVINKINLFFLQILINLLVKILF